MTRHTRSLILLACLLPVSACSDAGASAAAESSEIAALAAELARLEVQAPSPSVRRSRDAAGQPATPAAFEPREITRELTATVVVREPGRDEPLARETYRLSRDTVSITTADAAEWWLARNPLSRTELAGAHVDPAERLVLDHTAGDLRLTGCETLWDRAAALGGPSQRADGLTATGRTESAFGFTFAQWVAPDATGPLQEQWWSDEAALTLRSTHRVEGRLLTRELVRLESGVDPLALRHPAERHPEWQRSELSDRDDACGGSSPHARDEHAHEHGHGRDP